jgi:hypothetical protein
MAFQALGMLERAHHVLLERFLQFVFLPIGPPAAVLQEELETRDGVVYALPIFDFLSWAVGKRVIRCGMVTDSRSPKPRFASIME